MKKNFFILIIGFALQSKQTYPLDLIRGGYNFTKTLWNIFTDYIPRTTSWGSSLIFQYVISPASKILLSDNYGASRISINEENSLNTSSLNLYQSKHPSCRIRKTKFAPNSNNVIFPIPPITKLPIKMNALNASIEHLHKTVKRGKNTDHSAKNSINKHIEQINKNYQELTENIEITTKSIIDTLTKQKASKKFTLQKKPQIQQQQTNTKKGEPPSQKQKPTDVQTNYSHNNNGNSNPDANINKLEDPLRNYECFENSASKKISPKSPLTIETIFSFINVQNHCCSSLSNNTPYAENNYIKEYLFCMYPPTQTTQKEIKYLLPNQSSYKLNNTAEYTENNYHTHKQKKAYYSYQNYLKNNAQNCTPLASTLTNIGDYFVKRMLTPKNFSKAAKAVLLRKW